MVKVVRCVQNNTAFSAEPSISVTLAGRLCLMRQALLQSDYGKREWDEQQLPGVAYVAL